jgi:hypothetical protein
MSVMVLVSEKQDGTRLKASVQKDANDYSARYYINDEFVKTEVFHGRSIFYVEDAIENWFAGIKKLNG